MTKYPSADLESIAAYEDGFEVLKKRMIEGAGIITYLRQPAKDANILLVTSDNINSKALANLALEIKTYDELLENYENEHAVSRADLVPEGVFYNAFDPLYYDVEDMQDWLNAYSKYLKDKRNPEIISNYDMINFEKKPLGEGYKINNPGAGKKADVLLEKSEEASLRVIYHSLMIVAAGLKKVHYWNSMINRLGKRVDSFLDRKIFDKYKAFPSGTMDEIYRE
ncbi:MAG: hypothetical protein ACP5N3_00780 [Candidatus Nanoarchaeia archaeon]